MNSWVFPADFVSGAELGAGEEGGQVQYRISLSLTVEDVEQLWRAAAQRALAAPSATLDDMLDVIGPREDPAIGDCLAMLAAPGALAGCELMDFRVEKVPHRAQPVDPWLPQDDKREAAQPGQHGGLRPHDMPAKVTAFIG